MILAPPTIPAPQQLIEDLANVDADWYSRERVRLYCRSGNKLEEMSPNVSHFAWIEYRPYVVLAKANWDSDMDRIYPGEVLVEKPLDDVMGVEIKVADGCCDEHDVTVIWVRDSKGTLTRLYQDDADHDVKVVEE